MDFREILGEQPLYEDIHATSNKKVIRKIIAAGHISSYDEQITLKLLRQNVKFGAHLCTLGHITLSQTHK